MGGLVFLRWAVAAIFIVHAVPKLRDSKRFASGMGWTANQALGLGLIEFVSALAVAGGVGVKFASLLLMAVMFGAIYHKIFVWKVPFMAHDKTGWEFDMLILAATLTFFIRY